jgi:hypothetical protein
MSSNLQLTNALGSTGQFVKDQNGRASPLTLSTEVVGVGGAGHVGPVVIDDATGQHTIAIGCPQDAGRIDVGGHGARGQVAIFDENDNFTIDVFDAGTNLTMRIGSEEGPGRIGLGGMAPPV